jgi:hypothetical protein
MGTKILIFLALVLAIVMGWGWSAGQSASYEAQRGISESMIVRANGQARLDSAQAAAVLMAAAVPWLVLGILGVMGLGIIVLAVSIATRPSPGPALIERQIVYLPAPGQPRRETWAAIERMGRPAIAGRCVEIATRRLPDDVWGFLEDGNR